MAQQLPGLTFEVVNDPRDVSDAEDGSRLLARVLINGASYHCDMVRVVDIAEEDRDEDNCTQGPENPDDDAGIFDTLQLIHPGSRYETFEVAGFAGRFVACLFPFED